MGAAAPRNRKAISEGVLLALPLTGLRPVAEPSPAYNLKIIFVNLLS